MSSNLKGLTSIYGPDEVHGWPHIQRVSIYALSIGSHYSIDSTALSFACLFHDICKKDPGDHGLASSKEARKWLYKLDSKTLNIVLRSIEEHNKPNKPFYLEGQILQDADKLDGLGAIGLIRTIRDHSNVTPSYLVQALRTWQLEWTSMLWTKEAKALAESGFKILCTFTDQIHSELGILNKLKGELNGTN